MIKNLIIIFLICIIGSLLIAKPNNIEILKRAFFTTKDFVLKGTGNADDFFSGKKTLTEDSFFKEETEDSTKAK